MLTVQINYNTLQESIRHNKATEQQAKNELAETNRHNVFNENETQRHNLMSETIEQFKAQETVRHNVETEHISWYEAQTHRSLAQEQILGMQQERSIKSWQFAMDQFYQSSERDAALERTKAETKQRSNQALKDQRLMESNLDLAVAASSYIGATASYVTGVLRGTGAVTNSLGSINKIGPWYYGGK